MLTQHRARPRRGFSLVEVLLAITVTTVIGAAVTTLISRNARFFSLTAGEASARGVARTASSVLTSELRMVQDVGGISYASQNGDTITLRTPYAFGLVCNNGTPTTVSILPVDSAMNAMSTFGGWAYKNGTTYTYVDIPTVSSTLSPGTATTCTTTAGIRTLSVSGRNGVVWAISPGQAGITVGTPMFLYQRVRYVLNADSSSFRPYKSLRRQIMSGSTIVSQEELAGPLDTSSHFKYWNSTAGATSWTAPSATPAATLDSIKGVQLAFDAVALNTQPGLTPRVTKSRTSIFFRNRRAQ